MMFKRMMLVGASAAALVFTGCQDRSRQDQGIPGERDQTQQPPPATGGSGTDDTIPGSSDTLGGTPQDERPGVDLGGTGASGGAVDDTGGAGGAGTVDDQGTPGSLDQDGTGGSGTMDDQDSLDQRGTGGADDRDTETR